MSSQKVTIRESHIHGKGLFVCGRNVRAGDVLVDEGPFLWLRRGIQVGGKNDEDKNLCDYCLLSGELKSCSVCKSSSYCSKDCQAGHWKFHKPVCELIVATCSPEDSRVVRTVHSLSILLTADVDGLRDKFSKLLCRTNIMEEKRELKQEIYEWCQKAWIWQNRKKGQPPDFSVLHEEESMSKIRDVAELISRWFVNAFNISGTNDAIVGAYPTVTAANHSCAPNACYKFKGKVINLIALRDLDFDEEVLISYEPSQLMVSTKNMRNRNLESTFGFRCSCKECCFEVQRPLEDVREERQLFARHVTKLKPLLRGDLSEIPSEFIKTALCCQTASCKKNCIYGEGEVPSNVCLICKKVPDLDEAASCIRDLSKLCDQLCGKYEDEDVESEGANVVIRQRDIMAKGARLLGEHHYALTSVYLTFSDLLEGGLDWEKPEGVLSCYSYTFISFIESLLFEVNGSHHIAEMAELLFRILGNDGRYPVNMFVTESMVPDCKLHGVALEYGLECIIIQYGTSDEVAIQARKAIVEEVKQSS
eukprot:Nk52_evm30s2579 gene=Nk52_evmTU30s2579